VEKEKKERGCTRKREREKEPGVDQAPSRVNHKASDASTSRNLCMLQHYLVKQTISNETKFILKVIGKTKAFTYIHFQFQA